MKKATTSLGNARKHTERHQEEVAEREGWWQVYHRSRGAQERAGRVHGHLHGSHIVESVVQLFADGLVLQFLSIQLV